ncbi:flagellar basal body L-ring protein FlgH [Oleidesulfovibrio alaskensis]|uniref:flagellar basal body L-ring protein FlgH n=1 Tax=Oleidesulfovibrio alaskensis TaxID=58180 RepID=UPI001A627D27|nr:flagellar basal body L-ring protein FlgH [Oleidesulfovibrio alaskensis]MBL3581526.1 flagellar basal body L-ring protein FlgH [Oleidesulfovibrio alaskensis]
MRYAVICMLLLAASGCTAARQAPSPEPGLVPPPVVTTPEEKAKNPGSLFSDENADLLYADYRARRVGDIVLINIVENSKAENKASTSTNKESTGEYGVSSFFDRSKVGIIPGQTLLSGRTGDVPLLKFSSVSDFSGDGETTRENTVTATIAARVTRVLPGGLMQVEGSRETRVNEETQIVTVSGLVRTSDVADDNSVMSTQMADARISYYGKGVISDKQRVGWFTRLMDNLWPF